MSCKASHRFTKDFRLPSHQRDGLCGAIGFLARVLFFSLPASILPQHNGLCCRDVDLAAAQVWEGCFWPIFSCAFCPCDVTSSSSSCVAGGTRETRQQRRNNRTSFSDSRFECRKLTRIMKLYHVAQKPYLFARPVNAVIKSRRRDGRFLAPRDPGGA